MASKYREANGGYVVQFTLGDKRPKVRLGRVSERTVETVQRRIESLLQAHKHGSTLDNATAEWVAKIDDDLAEKLADLGLIPHRKKQRLADFLTLYISQRGEDLKAGSKTNLHQTERLLLEFFKADEPLAGITRARADEWVTWLRGGREKRLSPATVNRHVKRAREFFTRAVEWGTISANPFKGIKAGSETNAKRSRFISREVIDRVIDAAPDASWRLLIAMARYGGVRVPSELIEFTWADVDWHRGRIRIVSPKTERHDKAERTIPLFPELQRPLAEAFAAAPDGAVKVFPGIESGKKNLRQQFRRIIRAAGESTWPRLFSNLRASRATELADQFPAQTAAAWLGHSAVVALKHYLTVRPEHFDRAVNPGQIPGQHNPATPRTTAESESATFTVRDDIRPCGMVRGEKVTLTGFEPVSQP